jgi:hypothetical protein
MESAEPEYRSAPPVNRTKAYTNLERLHHIIGLHQQAALDGAGEDDERVTSDIKVKRNVNSQDGGVDNSKNSKTTVSSSRSGMPNSRDAAQDTSRIDLDVDYNTNEFDVLNDDDAGGANDADNNVLDLKTKRANLPTKHLNYSSHVLFHHFKDFPIGLLALRPVKMSVDRSFLRSSLRLFASTWAKLEQQQDEEERVKAPKFREKGRNAKVSRTKSGRPKRETAETEVNKKVNESSSGLQSGEDVFREIDKNDSISNINVKINVTQYDSDDKIAIKSKRENNWWSSKGNFNGDKARLSVDRSRGRSPAYRGGCFGTANKVDLKKADNFIR